MDKSGLKAGTEYLQGFGENSMMTTETTLLEMKVIYILTRPGLLYRLKKSLLVTDFLGDLWTRSALKHMYLS